LAAIPNKPLIDNVHDNCFYSIMLWLSHSVVLWNIATREAVCGSPAQALSSGLTHAVAYSNTSDDVFITGGKSVTLSCFILFCHFNLTIDSPGERCRQKTWRNA